MTKTYALKCPSCGADLKVGEDLTTFACAYCGNNVMVEKDEGIISLRLTDAIAQVQRGTDKTAAELAIVRLNKEIAAASSKLEEVINAKQNPMPSLPKSSASGGSGFINFVAVIMFIVIPLALVWPDISNGAKHLDATGHAVVAAISLGIVVYFLYLGNKIYQRQAQKIAAQREIWMKQEQQIRRQISTLQQRLKMQQDIANS